MIAVLFTVLEGCRNIPLELRPFSRILVIIGPVSTGSLVRHSASLLRGSLLSAPCLSFFSLRFLVLLFFSLLPFLSYFFFKFRLITMASTIDSTKRLITNDYYFSLHHIIYIVIIGTWTTLINRIDPTGGIIFISWIRSTRCIAQKARNVSWFPYNNIFKWLLSRFRIFQFISMKLFRILIFRKFSYIKC